MSSRSGSTARPPSRRPRSPWTRRSGVPVVTGGNTKSPSWTAGAASTLTYDTDAGATKTYAVADTVGFTTAIANVFGVAVTVSGATYLDTIVA